MSVAIKAAGGTHPGRVRQHNEDAFYPDPKDGTVDPTPISRGGHLFIVADGVGGNRGGARASQIAVGRVPAFYYSTVNGDPGRALRQALDSAAHEIVAEGATNPDRANMSCTIVAAVVQGNQATIAHLGDARAYLLRDGALRPLTRDHTWVQMQVEKGTLTETEAENHPDRNVITRSLGNPAFPEADVTQIALQAGDRLLLCSDGLCGVAGDAEMAAVLNRAAGPMAAVQPLIELANRKGGPDNVTALVVQIGPAAAAAAAPRRSAAAPLLMLLVLAASDDRRVSGVSPGGGDGAGGRLWRSCRRRPFRRRRVDGRIGPARLWLRRRSGESRRRRRGRRRRRRRRRLRPVYVAATPTAVAVIIPIITAAPSLEGITLLDPPPTSCPPPDNSPQYSGNRTIDFRWRIDGAPVTGGRFLVRAGLWGGQWKEYGNVSASGVEGRASIGVGEIYEAGADQYQWQVVYAIPGQGEVLSAVSCFRISGSGGGGPAATAPMPTEPPIPTATNTLEPTDSDGDGVPDSRDECPDDDAGSIPDPARPGCPS
ncbi:MAG: protein phosphatase 2C domain-containing protein [Candidatus Promineofilum sp.]|uniref:PP2C family protein-serine/threonine phosphatase n=1 Tax=Promineifilum sp. TaxID=2664178 RepID=UPI002411E35E|nr:protein phosphatase 2C domain-containing protein [Promineifilum sp.]